MLSKCCTQYVRKFGKPRRGHKIGKGQSSSQFPKRAVLKNVQATRQLHTSPMLVRLCSKFYMLGSVNMLMWTKNFQMSKLGLEKAEEPEIKLPTFTLSQRKLGNSRETSISVSSSTPKPLTVWILINFGKLLKRWEYPTILPVSWETCMQVKKQQLEPSVKQLIGLRLRKEYDRAVCCHPVCLIYMLSASWEMLGWMSYKLESRFSGEISTTSDMQIITP